jgi:hypothetical protein
MLRLAFCVFPAKAGTLIRHGFRFLPPQEGRLVGTHDAIALGIEVIKVDL